MKPEDKRILLSFVPGFIFVLLLGSIKFYEIYFNVSFVQYGLYPRSIPDLRGIITTVLIHHDFEHYFSNAIPLIVLFAMLFYFYRDTAYKVIFSIWLLAGLWLWLGGRPSYHIGASGLVYGLASFIFFSGVIRREKGVMALSLLVVFLYGSMIWGLLPIIQGVSWEAHLFGGLSGFLIAWHFRKTGPQRKVYEWPDEENEVDDHENTSIEEDDALNQNTNTDSQDVNSTNLDANSEIKYNYSYKPKEDEKN